MKIECAHDKVVDLDTLVPNPRNANEHPDAQIKLLAKIMKHQGWRNPIVVSNRSGFMTKGHGRLLAAKLNGWTHAPVDYQDYRNEADEWADMIADNKIAELAESNEMRIQEIAVDLGPDFDFELFGIPDFQIAQPETVPQCDEDEIPEYVEPKAKLGDIYNLGAHRLMCGDSTSIDSVEKLMNGEKADMVYTDPPYGMFLDTDFTPMDGLRSDGTSFHRTSGGKKHKQVQGDHEDFNPEFINTVFAAFPEARDVFLWGADYYTELLPERNSGSWIVWDKRTNEGATPEQSESADRVFGSNFELCWSMTRHKRELARIRNGIFGVKNESGNSSTVHPTQKPVQLAEWFFERWGKSEDNVADLFGGSGTTMIAAEKTGRNCFMMELDPKYCDVIVARWEKYTGKEAELING